MGISRPPDDFEFPQAEEKEIVYTEGDEGELIRQFIKEIEQHALMSVNTSRAHENHFRIDIIGDVQSDEDAEALLQWTPEGPDNR